MDIRRLARFAALAFVTLCGTVIVSLGGCNSSSAPQPAAQNGPQGLAQPGQGPASIPSTDAPLGRRTVPRGFAELTDANGSGQLVFAKFPSGGRSASATMREFLGYTQGYFDSPLQFLGAVGDQQDKVVQAMWHGTFQGQPIRGVATVTLGSTDGMFAMLFDRPQLFAASYSRLAQQLGNMMPRSAQGGGGGESAVNWSRQTTGDRTAAATVPQGWRVTGCVNGALDIFGPNDQNVELGLAFPVFTSALPGYQGTVAPYMNPVQALGLYESNMNFNQYRSTSSSAFGRIIETTPVQNPNGQGMYILQEVSNNNGSKKVLAMVLTSPVAQNEWLLYISFASANQSSFAHDLPIMMKIWGSWKVDDRVFQQRMQQALANMRETSNILNSMHDNQSRVYDNINTAMDMVIRGHWPVENTETGSRVELEQNTATELEKECQNQGIPCRQVPINQLTGGH